LYLVSPHVGVVSQVQLHFGSELGLILAIESRKSDALDLNVNSLRKLFHRDTAPRRLVSEPLGVLLIHALPRVSL